MQRSALSFIAYTLKLRFFGSDNREIVFLSFLANYLDEILT